MRVHRQARQLQDVFQRYAPGAKMILLHPDCAARSLLLAGLMNQSATPVFYCALDARVQNLRDFVAGARRSLAAQCPTFGRRLNLLRPSALDNPARHLNQITRAFAREIRELRPDSFFLILDDFDHANSADDILTFVERLAQRLPRRCKIVLNGRALPRLPWLSILARDDAVVLDETGVTLRGVVAARQLAQVDLRMHAMGPGFAFHDDQLVRDWDGHLPRLLLCAAMERPSATRNQLCRLLWRELDLDQAVNVFHLTKRRLHKALGVDVLNYSGDAYRMDELHPVYYDACEFVSAIMAARHGEPARALEHWQRAADLYRGPFLQGHDDAWIVDRREAFQSAYIEALRNIAAIHERRDRHDLALSKLMRAIETDYADERLHREALRLYMKLGRRPEAALHIREYEQWASANKSRVSRKMMTLSAEIFA